ncbi:MAG: LamG domain-containing protein [Candidatus Scalindua sp.]
MKKKYLQPEVSDASEVLRLKLYDGPNWSTAGPVLRVFDYSLSNHPGELKGTATFKYPGVDLDGNSDYIEIVDHADFTPGSNNLVTNGDFSAWTNDDPDGWAVDGEVGSDPEVSQVGDGESHGGAGTGYCNIFTSDVLVQMIQTISLVTGRRYKVSININTLSGRGIVIYDIDTGMFTDKIYSSTGTKVFYFVANADSLNFRIKRRGGGASDVTFDDVSVMLVKPFSISAWVYMHDATDFTIASKGVEVTDGEWRFYTDGSDKLFAHFYDEDIDKYIGRTYNAAALTQNIWLHLVTTYNGEALSAGVKLYLNGVQVDDADSLSATFVAVEDLGHDIWIGRYANDYANGLIDNITIHKKELSAAEVHDIYKQTKWRYGV